MTLNIYEIEGVFELQGEVTTYNAQQVEKYFEVMLRLKPQVIINLSRLESMDVAGVYAFYNLLNQASKEGKFLRFVGANNFKLQNAFLNSGCNLFDFNYFDSSAKKHFKNFTILSKKEL